MINSHWLYTHRARIRQPRQRVESVGGRNDERAGAGGRRERRGRAGRRRERARQSIDLFAQLRGLRAISGGDHLLFEGGGGAVDRGQLLRGGGRAAGAGGKVLRLDRGDLRLQQRHRGRSIGRAGGVGVRSGA